MGEGRPAGGLFLVDDDVGGLQQGGQVAVWFILGLAIAALLSIYGVSRTAPRRGLALALSGVVMVALGATVTWTNRDPGMVHTVTAVDGSFDSGFMNEGDTFSFTFNTPGEFEYFCGPHPWMRAKVQVEMH